MLVMAVGMAGAASAQFNGRVDSDRPDGWHVRVYRGEDWNHDYHSIDEMNRAFDQRVRSVENDYTLRPKDKRKIIREINEERKFRIKAARKFERRERRRAYYGRDND